MTTATLRPNATVAGGGASFTGGAGTWHGNTSDNSDLSYTTLAPLSLATLNLTAVTLPTGR